MKFCQYLSSSIGRKFFMAITGLLLSGFLITHVSGNFLLFVGAEAYNEYSHAIVSNPLLYVAEFGLLALFLIHLYFGISLTIENRKARTSRYAVSAKGAKATPIASKTMILSGFVILVFVPLHLYTFKYGPHYLVSYNGVEMRDLYTLVMETFQNSILYVIWYIFAMFVLAFHLYHGIQSTFQSLGLNHPRYRPLVTNLSRLVALFIAIGFSTQPIYALLIKGGM